LRRILGNPFFQMSAAIGVYSLPSIFVNFPPSW